MYNDFIVKVHRYWEDDNGSRGWDGWYFSKVYAIDGNEFLVYDDGGMSAYNGEEDFCETGFNWVDFTATMDRCGENGRQPIVEPLASFNIADYLADRKTENSSEKPNNKVIQQIGTVGRWIPCSERLPKEDGFYLVTITDGEQIAVCKMPFVESEWKGNWFDDEVIAWLPLPSAYQGEGADDEL